MSLIVGGNTYNSRNIFNLGIEHLKPILVKCKPFLLGYSICLIGVQLPVSFVVVAYQGMKNRDGFSFKRSAADFTRYALFPWPQIIARIWRIGKKMLPLKEKPIRPPQRSQQRNLGNQIPQGEPRKPEPNFSASDLWAFQEHHISLTKPEVENELLKAAFAVTPQTRKEFASFYAQQDAASIEAARELLNKNLYLKLPLEIFATFFPEEAKHWKQGGRIRERSEVLYGEYKKSEHKIALLQSFAYRMEAPFQAYENENPASMKGVAAAFHLRSLCLEITNMWFGACKLDTRETWFDTFGPEPKEREIIQKVLLREQFPSGINPDYLYRVLAGGQNLRRDQKDSLQTTISKLTQEPERVKAFIEGGAVQRQRDFFQSPKASKVAKLSPTKNVIEEELHEEDKKFLECVFNLTDIESRTQFADLYSEKDAASLQRIKSWLERHPNRNLPLEVFATFFPEDIAHWMKGTDSFAFLLYGRYGKARQYRDTDAQRRDMHDTSVLQSLCYRIKAPILYCEKFKIWEEPRHPKLVSAMYHSWMLSSEVRQLWNTDIEKFLEWVVAKGENIAYGSFVRDVVAMLIWRGVYFNRELIFTTQGESVVYSKEEWSKNLDPDKYTQLIDQLASLGQDPVAIREFIIAGLAGLPTSK